jgi:hypothetical protein
MGSMLVKAWNQSRDTAGGTLLASSRSALNHVIYMGSGDAKDNAKCLANALLAPDQTALARCLTRRLLPLMELLIHPGRAYVMSS